MAEELTLIDVPLPESWKSVNPGERQAKNTQILEAVYVAPSACDGFAANIVVFSQHGRPQDFSQWLKLALESLHQAFPGFCLIDQQPWSSGHAQGVLISGVYVIENINVTLMRWLLVGEKSTFSIDATCATAELAELSDLFVECASSCRER